MPSVAAFVDAYDPTGKRAKAFKASIDSLNHLTHRLDGIYVMGSGGYERKCRGWANVTYNEHENMPLSDKRQAGMEVALASGADYLLSIGSDDLVHPEYLTQALDDIRGYDWVGVRRWWIAHYNVENSTVAYQRCEYVDRDDPMGAGRLYRADFIRESCSRMWEPGKSYTLDGNNARVLERAGAKMGYTDGHITLMKGPWESLTKLYHFYNPKKTRFLPAGKRDVGPIIAAHGDVLERVLTAPPDTVVNGPRLQTLVDRLNRELGERARLSVRALGNDMQFTIGLRKGFEKRPVKHFCNTVSCQELPIQIAYILNVKAGIKAELNAPEWTGAALRERK
jgi:hypothetical protein